MKLLRRRNVWFILVGILVIGGIIAFRSEPRFVPLQASVQFLPAQTLLKGPPLTWFERSVPFSWVWLWRLRDKVRRKPASLSIESSVIRCHDFSEERLSGAFPSTAAAETNGLRGWILDASALAALQQELERTGAQLLTRPRVTTSDGVVSGLFVGASVQVAKDGDSQFTLDLLPRVHRDGLELMTKVALMEMFTRRSPPGVSNAPPNSSESNSLALTTNFTAATRWVLPEGAGFFLLGPNVSNNSSRIAVIATAKVKRGGK